MVGTIILTIFFLLRIRKKKMKNNQISLNPHVNFISVLILLAPDK